MGISVIFPGARVTFSGNCKSTLFLFVNIFGVGVKYAFIFDSFTAYFITGISGVLTFWVSDLSTTVSCQFFDFVFNGPPCLYGHTNSG